VAPKNFEVLGGELAVYNSSPGVYRGFCSTCGTSLSYWGNAWTDYAILSSTLDNPAAAKPTRNVFTSHKQPWVALDGDLKNSPEFP